MKNKEAIQTGERFRRWFMQYAGQFAFLIILFVVLSIASPTFRTATNLIYVARQVSINMIIACAMTLVLIIGGIDLSVGAVMAMSGMVSAYLSLMGIPFGICLLAGLGVGAVSGLIDGLILANTHLPAFIVTYAIQNILRGMVYVITGAGTIRKARAGKTLLRHGLTGDGFGSAGEEMLDFCRGFRRLVFWIKGDRSWITRSPLSKTVRLVIMLYQSCSGRLAAFSRQCCIKAQRLSTSERPCCVPFSGAKPVAAGSSEICGRCSSSSACVYRSSGWKWIHSTLTGSSLQ